MPVKIEIMNKYLEKIAGFAVGRAIGRAADFAEKVVGHRASTLRAEAEAVSRHAAAGRTPREVQRMASHATRQTRDARIKAGLGVGAIGTAGFLGIHRYHQHKDRAIMERLNTMYRDPNGTGNN